MKKYITFLLLVAAIGTKAQTQVTSRFAGDKIWILPGGVEARGTVVNIYGDTLRSVSYSFTVPRDTTGTVNVLVSGYNKAGSLIMTAPMQLSAKGYKNWKSLLTPIDAAVVSAFPKILFQ